MSKHTKFWNFIKNDAGERVLRLEGPIDSENFWGDAITPKMFREELEADEGDITVWINSPGGSVFAAAEIYTMLCEYSNNKRGRVTVKIDAIAASAASVVAMAGERVLMSPVAMLFIHDPMTMAMGNAHDMEKVITTLNEIKESIINAYQKKTGLSRNKISKLMSDETWLNAKKAVELGFADEILFADNSKSDSDDEHKDGDDDADAGDHSPDTASEEGISLKGGDGQSVASKTKNSEDTFWGYEWQPYSTRAMGQAILNRLIPAVRDDAVSEEANSEAADTEAVLESSLTATAEETPQEVQTQEEEAHSEANTEANAVSDISSDESDVVTDDTTNAEEGQTEEPAETQTEESTQATDNAHDNVAEANAVATGDDQELSAEDSEPVTVIVTDDVAANNLPDDLKTPEAPTEPKTAGEAKQELTIGLDGKAKDGSMPYALLEKQLQLLR